MSSCAFKFNFLIMKNLFVASLVFPSVECDAGDLDRVFLSQASGYVYPQPPLQLGEAPTHIYLPPPPIFADETPIFPAPYTPPESYLLPSSFPVYLPPPNEIFSTVETPFPPPPPNDDTVVISALPLQNSGVYSPSQAQIPPQFKIENMSCIQGLNFRATFKMAGDLSQFPVMDDATEGCITALNGNMFKIGLENINSMLKCGVRRCKSSAIPQARNGASGNSNFRNIGQGDGENMCVVLRMPTVRGVRLPEDQMITLVCIPQDRVVSRTRHVRLGSNKIFQNSRGRSTNGFVATGGTQKDLKSRISIFRKRSGTNIFDQNVLPESVIQLGEELVLRAVITDGDGWQSSQIGPIIVSGLKSKKSALLVNQNGCVNPEMKSICPQHPIKVNPLSIELHFRAFLFQESSQGDEMVVSVKMQGCLHPQDCLRIDSCRDEPSTVRSKRELSKLNTAPSQKIREKHKDMAIDVKNWESQLWFRVEPPSAKMDNLNLLKSTEKESLNWFVLYLIGFVFLSFAIVLTLTLLVWLVCSRKEFNK